jgi:hypothetical protein
MKPTLLFCLFTLFILIAKGQSSKSREIDSLLNVQSLNNKIASTIKTYKTYWNDSVVKEQNSYMFNPETGQLLFVRAYFRPDQNDIGSYTTFFYFIDNEIVKAETFMGRFPVIVPYETYYYSEGKCLPYPSVRDYSIMSLEPWTISRDAQLHLKFFNKNYLGKK